MVQRPFGQLLSNIESHVIQSHYAHGICPYRLKPHVHRPTFVYFLDTICAIIIHFYAHMENRMCKYQMFLSKLHIICANFIFISIWYIPYNALYVPYLIFFYLQLSRELNWIRVILCLLWSYICKELTTSFSRGRCMCIIRRNYFI